MDQKKKTFKMLSGMRILLIGASGDLGLAMAERFLDEGSILWASGNRHMEGLQKLLGNSKGRLNVFPMDVTNNDSIQNACEEIQKSDGLDAVVYNAGIVRDNPVLAMEEEDWLSVLDVNLTGAFRVVKTFGKLFFRAKKGKLLFISSVAGQKGGRGQTNYAASKAGLEGFVRSLAADFAPRGVLVNAIAPGPLESKMTLDVMKVAGEEVLRKIALKRLGQPREVASLAAHLLSPDISWMTGQVISIDGGFQ